MTLWTEQMTFEQALRTREFEDDAPNYTPRISGIMHIKSGTIQLCNVDFKKCGRRPVILHQKHVRVL